MQLSEFLTPSDDEWIGSLGVATEPVDGEETVRRVKWSSGSGQEFELTYSVTTNSIGLSWTDDGIVRLQLFRDNARRILTWSGRGAIPVT
jgi:hypothetical protein